MKKILYLGMILIKILCAGALLIGNYILNCIGVLICAIAE